MKINEDGKQSEKVTEGRKRSENYISPLCHLSVMETQLHHNDSSGNWIAFLFGAMFNVMANLNDHGTINYFGHAIVGGFICLLFKMIGDLLTPLLQSLGNRFRQWLDKQNHS